MEELGKQKNRKNYTSKNIFAKIAKIAIFR